MYFPDIPGAVTGGNTLEECAKFGEDILKEALRELTANQKPIPEPFSLHETKKKVAAMRQECGLETSAEALYQLFPKINNINPGPSS